MSGAAESSDTRPHYTLAFFGAAWSPPTAPMSRIFEETLIDMARLAPGVKIAGAAIDLGGAETIEGTEPGDTPADPSLAAVIPTLRWVPTIMALDEQGNECACFEGMMPKLEIRRKLLAVFAGKPETD